MLTTTLEFVWMRVRVLYIPIVPAWRLMTIFENNLMMPLSSSLSHHRRPFWKEVVEYIPIAMSSVLDHHPVLHYNLFGVLWRTISHHPCTLLSHSLRAQRKYVHGIYKFNQYVLYTVSKCSAYSHQKYCRAKSQIFSHFHGTVKKKRERDHQIRIATIRIRLPEW